MSKITAIAPTKDFQRDFKKLSVKQVISPAFIEVFHCLQNKQPLPKQYKDHALQGSLKGYRDCHIFNDLVLIYKIEDDTLYLVRLNTHSEVFK